jgi:hypothetical protein
MHQDAPVAEDLPVITTYRHGFKLPDGGTRPVEVAVFESLMKKHKDRCLCFRCEKFEPEDRENNCSIANLLFAACVQCDIVAPVAECRADMFVERDTPHPWL